MFTRKLSRRTFIRASLAGALVLGGAGPLLARAVPPVELPEGTLSLFNTHNNEHLRVTFRQPNGDYDLDALNALNWILRCHYTNEETIMDVRTIEYLNLMDKKLGGGNEIHIISGYRSPSYNSMLRSNGRHVAKQSLHLSGRAIDITIPGISIDQIRRTALALRMGGVGNYPGAGFVHIDSGPFRSW